MFGEDTWEEAEDLEDLAELSYIDALGVLDCLVGVRRVLLLGGWVLSRETQE